MAINQNEVVTSACARIIQCVNSIADGLDAIESIQEQIAASGIDLLDFSALIEGDPRTQHAEATTYKNMIDTFAPSIVSGLKALYSGSPTQQGWVCLQKLRRATTGPLR